jgi:ketosteroid isomerase-like protein
MHLHGFFYSVLSRGTATADTIYVPDQRRLVVTESMRPRTTMSMEWTPTRPGRWLFHCHLSFHVTSELRLPGAEEADPEHAHSHMAGLVIGIDVAPGPSDLISRGPPVDVDLYANEYGDQAGYRYGFAVDPDFVADSLSDVPGPLLVFNQYQTVNATVHNRTSVPTGVHWHGLELDGWADGVPDWSASDGRVSPAIAPGDSFTYRLSLMRPGTFVYHSHLDDVHQLSGGLYGPLLVLPEGERFDPRTDHLMIWGWNHPDGRGMEQRDLNGRHDQPDATGHVGEEHRFRVINIAPADRVSAWLTLDGEVVPIMLHAKDGADLPPSQRIAVDRLPRLGAGEAADFTWTPAAPGTYELHVGFAPDPGASLVQRWVVRERALEQREVHRQAIDNAYRNWVDATNARDLDRWASFLAPEPLFLPPNHPALRGEPVIREFYERLFADDRFSLNCRQEHVEVAEAQDMAWSTGSCEATFTGSDGEVARGSSKWAKVWMRQPNGDWKCTLNSWSVNGPSEGGD